MCLMAFDWQPVATTGHCLTLLGNRDVPDTGIDDEALRAVAAALDDLRRLGEADHRLSQTSQ